MKKIYIAIIAILATTTVFGQQNPYTSMFNDTRAFWNPAYTANGDDMVFNTLLRKQWVGFAQTPTSGFVDFQYPFVDYNMSAGAQIVYDQTGPVSKTGVQANYAYKLKEIGRSDGQLSFGLSAGISNYNFNASDQVFNDDGDPLLAGTGSAIFPNIGVGMFYISNMEEFRGDNAFYFGLAANQALETNVLINEFNQKRTRHIVAELGTKIYTYDSYFEPSFTVNYVNPEIIDLMVGAKYEMEDAFWAGLGYSSVNDLIIQGGVILPEVGGRYTEMKIGALANVGVSDNFQNLGPSFEVFVNYSFEMR